MPEVAIGSSYQQCPSWPASANTIGGRARERPGRSSASSFYGPEICLVSSAEIVLPRALVYKLLRNLKRNAHEDAAHLAGRSLHRPFFCISTSTAAGTSQSRAYKLRALPEKNLARSSGVAHPKISSSILIHSP